MTRDRPAFSMLELIITMMLVGVMAAIAVPRFSTALITKNRASTTARKIATDLRLARRLAISDAANNAKGFQLTMVGTSYEIENLDTHATVASHAIDSEVSCIGGGSFAFGPLGNITNSGFSDLIVSGGGRSYTITATKATGAVKCVEN